MSEPVFFRCLATGSKGGLGTAGSLAPMPAIYAERADRVREMRRDFGGAVVISRASAAAHRNPAHLRASVSGTRSWLGGTGETRWRCGRVWLPRTVSSGARKWSVVSGPCAAGRLYEEELYGFARGQAGGGPDPAIGPTWSYADPDGEEERYGSSGGTSDDADRQGC